MLILTGDEVERLLDLDVLLDALAAAMADLSSGNASSPPRTGAMVAERGGLLGAMPAYLPSSDVLAAKLVSVFPSNAALKRPTHQAVVLVFDASNGSPVALMDGTYITAARTAAGSALAARYLARPDSSVLAILGTGVQARAHARAMAGLAPWSEVRVAGRDPDRTRTLAADLAGWMSADVRHVDSYEAALDGADVVCATTHSPEPIVRREWLSPGMHVSSVGFNRSGPEVDAATVADALVVVESRDIALAPHPVGPHDLHQPLSDGIITPDHIHAEVGELVLGTREGRTSPEQITLYKSVGVGIQDAAAASVVLDAARGQGVGREIEI